MDRSEGERRAAQRPGDQPESEGKRPSDLTASQRDNIQARCRLTAGLFFYNFFRSDMTPLIIMAGTQPDMKS